MVTIIIITIIISIVIITITDKAYSVFLLLSALSVDVDTFGSTRGMVATYIAVKMTMNDANLFLKAHVAALLSMDKALGSLVSMTGQWITCKKNSDMMRLYRLMVSDNKIKQK